MTMGSRLARQLDAPLRRPVASAIPVRARLRESIVLGLRLGLTSLAAAAGFGILGGPGGISTAKAASMDLTPERLVLQPPLTPGGATCQQVAANPELAVSQGFLPNFFPCLPDHAAFKNIMSELGFAIAPPVMRPARTTGLAGFSVGLEITATTINSGGVAKTGTAYWRQGTQGAFDGTNYSSVNDSPSSLLQVYALKVRKGLPLGFEIGTAIGYLGGTSMGTVGLDLRWAFLEGFRTGAFGYLPDLSAGVGVRTLMGSPKLYLTTLAADVVASKPITLADSGRLTPYVGYQYVFIFGNSTIMDFTPNVDALRECGYAGPHPDTGKPVCERKLSNGADNNSDFNNNSTFIGLQAGRHRGIFGLQYKYEILQFGGQLATDLVDPSSVDGDLVGGRQWTFSLEGGAAF